MAPVLAGHHGYKPLLALLSAATTATLLTACGSSGPAQSSAAVKSACQQVSAVLSDGPDPDADPVGYAEAQIQPLHQIHTSDQTSPGAASTKRRCAASGSAGRAKTATRCAAR